MKKDIRTRKIINAYASFNQFNGTEFETKHYDQFMVAKSELESVLDSVQARSKVRTITVRGILDILKQIDSQLNITNKAKEGTTITVDINAQDFPRAYKYTPESTVFDAVYKSGEWRITDIRRDICKRHKAFITLSDTAKEAILQFHETYR